MNAFQVHQRVNQNYIEYLQSFLNIRDPRIRQVVSKAFQETGFLPEPLIQFNPAYQKDETLQDLVDKKLIHPDLVKIFGSFNLYKHQIEALKLGSSGKGFVVTSGTGSGKSLTYLASIFDYICKLPEKKPGIKAVIVYPMNALINSQELEIKKFNINFLNSFLSDDRKKFATEEIGVDELIIDLQHDTGKTFPFSFAKYTGQEDQDRREEIKDLQPDIILTNYMMLELIMTRHAEEWMRDLMKDQLRFLVFDELHTYRGRQGSDVSLLIRRIKNQTKGNIIFIGTSATMATEGTLEAKKQIIANVASTIFGESYSTEQVTTEYLESITDFQGELPDKKTLAYSINGEIDVTKPPADFLKNPLTVWLENKIALKREEGNYIERGQPRTISEIANELAADSGESGEKCRNAILNLLKWTEELNKKQAALKHYESFLPFKLHQFISQTSTVYVTLEPKAARKITVQTTRYLKDEHKGEQLVFPLLFSRYSGYEFICVTKNYKNNTLEPRDPDSDLPFQWTQDDIKAKRKTGKQRRVLNAMDFPGGYLIIPDEGDEIWSDDQWTELPESWMNHKKGPEEPKDYYKYQLPARIWFNNDGKFSDEESSEYDQWAWYMPAKLLFDPTAGIIYDRKTNENTKLMRLGNEGRSTATTLLAYSVIAELSAQNEPLSDQKILSFTDNRQDASLQAGHFNDFISTGQLRSAVYHALMKENNRQLRAFEIAERVVRHLNIEESQYALNPNMAGWKDPENERALKIYIFTRILYDLRRSWRYNLPNLEQTGLLVIDYYRLDEFARQDEFFKGIRVFETMDPGERYARLVQVLNYYRTNYALDYPEISAGRADAEAFMSSKLDPAKPWGPEKNEKIDIPAFMTARNPGKTNRFVYTASMGPQSYLGKYIKRIFKEKDIHPMDRDDYTDYIEKLCQVLKNGNFLKEDKVRGDKGTVNGYRLRVDAVIWKAGDGRTVLPDEVRISSYKDWRPEPNTFFRKFYQQDFSKIGKPVYSREHTGQLETEDRIDREDKFRNGIISSLFCSPTMELGIDIANLNIVHMRNVPPTPANYAQRSGRAGRSGQAALVYTYCSQGSPHDRNYFSKPEKMISGIVVPPRIDQTNEELIRSHFNAFLLMKLAIGEMRVSVADVLNVADKINLPVKVDIAGKINQGIKDFGARWENEFLEVIADLIPRLRAGNWFTRDWIHQNCHSFYESFDKSFERWRVLFLAAEDLIRKARKTMDDPDIKQDSPNMDQAKRQHNLGLNQRALLLNETRKTSGNQSEFYIYRYLASEGFLPGYNFTRLPVRAFLGFRYTQQGEYISRPRFIALREFGPNNLIYHNGEKYRVNRLMLTDVSLKMVQLKASPQTSYAFMGEEAERFTNDPITGLELSGSNVIPQNNLLELSESEALPQMRISCEEEERMSTGYDIDQYFNYPKGRGNTRESVIKFGDQPMLNLIFCQAAQLIQVNNKWKRTKDTEGFMIDDRNGQWMKQADLENPENNAHGHEVRIFATDTADTLYIQPVKDLKISPEQVASLSFALKRGIEQKFQVEESEIGIWIMGNPEEPNIMIYEAAEGSLGILSQLVDKPSDLTGVFNEAYKTLHFDPATRKDTRPDLPRATYEDLLSYYNQKYHDQLDRFAIKEVLEKLIDARIEPKTDGLDREEQYQLLLSLYDKSSGTEKPFIDYLYQNGYVLPVKAQVNIRECYVNADFVFNTENGQVLVFCDGSVHDGEDVKKEDQSKRQCLADHGYDVIVWHYKTPISELIEKRKDVFRKIM